MTSKRSLLRSFVGIGPMGSACHAMSPTASRFDCARSVVDRTYIFCFVVTDSLRDSSLKFKALFNIDVLLETTKNYMQKLYANFKFGANACTFDKRDFALRGQHFARNCSSRVFQCINTNFCMIKIWHVNHKIQHRHVKSNRGLYIEKLGQS